MSAQQLKKRSRAVKARGVPRMRETSHGESLGQRLSRLRKERGITQVELAQVFGVSQPVISEYERDGLALRWDHLIALARLLHVSVDALLGVEQEATTRRGPKGRLLKAFEAASSLPKRQQQLVEHFV